MSKSQFKKQKGADLWSLLTIIFILLAPKIVFWNKCGIIFFHSNCFFEFLKSVFHCQRQPAKWNCKIISILHLINCSTIIRSWNKICYLLRCFNFLNACIVKIRVSSIGKFSHPVSSYISCLLVSYINMYVSIPISYNQLGIYVYFSDSMKKH